MKRRKVLILTAAISLLTCFSAFAGEWKQDDTGWWYDNGDTTYESDGWSWINERWYYFSPEGYCLLNTTTPDGFQVDESGAWAVDGVIQTMGREAAVISPVLNFVKPEGFSRNSKIDGLAYTKSGLLIKVEDTTGKQITQPELEEFGTACQFNSGEWWLYYRNSTSNSFQTSSAIYMRIVGDHVHRIEFSGSALGSTDTNALMNACVR